VMRGIESEFSKVAANSKALEPEEKLLRTDEDS
jgi:hypothetical protein